MREGDRLAQRVDQVRAERAAGWRGAARRAPRAPGRRRSTSTRSPRRWRRRRGATRRSGRARRWRGRRARPAAGRRAAGAAPATSTLPWIQALQLCTSPSRPSQCQSRRVDERGRARAGRPRAGSGRAAPGTSLVELVAEQVVDPGELGGDLAGAEVEERVGDGRDDRAVPAAGVVVGGPAPGALLAQQGHAVGDLVDPQWIEGGRGQHGGPAEAPLAGEDDLLVPVAVAVAEVPRVAVRERQRPRRCRGRRAARSRRSRRVGGCSRAAAQTVRSPAGGDRQRRLRGRQSARGTVGCDQHVRPRSPAERS